MTFGKTSVGEAPQPLTDHKCEMTAGINVVPMNPVVGTSLDGFRDHFLSRVRLGAVFMGTPPARTAPVMIDSAPIMASMRSCDSATSEKPCASKLDGSPPRVKPPAIFPAAVQVSRM